jgi:hypothetical protein
VIVDEDAGRAGQTEAATGQRIDLGIRLGVADLGRADDVVEEVEDAESVAQALAQRAVGVAENADAIDAAERADERDVLEDGPWPSRQRA